MDINKLGTINLLLVEDDIDFSYSLVSRLKKRNFNVTTLSSAKEALDLFIESEGAFDVVVTDIKLEGMDGIVLLEKLKAHNEDLPVILITGYASLNSAREAVKFNAFDYLLKPFDSIEDILNPVYKAVYSYRLVRENRKLMEEIKGLKEYYEDIVLSVPNAILTINKSLEIESVNKTFFKIFTDRKENVAGKSVSEVFDNYVNDKLIDFLYFNNSEEGLCHFEWETKLKQGAPFNAEISLGKTCLAGQEFILMVITDITEMRQAEQEKKEMQTHFFQMQKTEALGMLASGVAHEFNNVLSIILGHAQLSLEEESIGEIQDSLHKIEQVTKRGGDIVKKLAAYAKPKEPFFVTGDITTVIEEVIKLQERQLFLENITIEKKFSDHSRVSFDFGQMEQVFINLILNSAHAIRPKGKGKISVSVSDTGGKVEISFSDTGIGIEDDVKSKIFEPFFTTKSLNNNSYKAERSGTGLGLSISYTIIKQHGGEIRVESIKGEGSTFIITLPAAEAGSAGSYDGSVISGEPKIEDVKGLRILLVDDEDDMISLMKSLFEKAGFESVFVVQSGREAIAAFNEVSPDIVFLDIVMPDISGFEVFKEIREKNRDVPVVFTTGKIDLSDEEFREAHLCDEDNYELLQKPFGMDDILSVLSSVVKKTYVR